MGRFPPIARLRNQAEAGDVENGAGRPTSGTSLHVKVWPLQLVWCGSLPLADTLMVACTRAALTAAVSVPMS